MTSRTQKLRIPIDIAMALIALALLALVVVLVLANSSASTKPGQPIAPHTNEAWAGPDDYLRVQLVTGWDPVRGQSRRYEFTAGARVFGVHDFMQPIKAFRNECQLNEVFEGQRSGVIVCISPLVVVCVPHHATYMFGDALAPPAGVNGWTYEFSSECPYSETVRVISPELGLCAAAPPMTNDGSRFVVETEWGSLVGNRVGDRWVVTPVKHAPPVP